MYTRQVKYRKFMYFSYLCIFIFMHWTTHFIHSFLTWKLFPNSSLKYPFFNLTFTFILLFSVRCEKQIRESCWFLIGTTSRTKHNACIMRMNSAVSYCLMYIHKIRKMCKHANNRNMMFERKKWKISEVGKVWQGHRWRRKSL